MDAQEAFNAFLYDHYIVCREKECEPGNIVEGILQEVIEESYAEPDKQRLIHKG